MKDSEKEDRDMERKIKEREIQRRRGIEKEERYRQGKTERKK